MSRIQQVKAILSDAPATAQEVALELETTPRIAAAHIQILVRRGQVKKAGEMPRAEKGGRVPFLWELAA
jgi:predicted ArsR family transcriptional regulator